MVGGRPAAAGDSRGDAASVEGIIAAPSSSASRRPLMDLQAIEATVIDGIRLLVAHQTATTNQEKALAAAQDAANKRESLLAAREAELAARAESVTAREAAVAQLEGDLTDITVELNATRARADELTW